MKKCDGVFEGGGVKGIGFAGAIEAVEQAGYEFENVVGTSAGAIVAALVAAGYTGKELKQVMSTVDYSKFREPTKLSKLGLIGNAISILCYYGAYSSDYFKDWFQDLLDKKGVKTFGDLRTRYSEDRYKYKFQAVASDLSIQKILVLPGDLKQFGIDPDTFEVAEAVQMSMSIPFFYKPKRMKTWLKTTHYIVDGGLLSNYPVWILDDKTREPSWPTFGFKFKSKSDGTANRTPASTEINNIVDYTKSIISTLLDGHDNYYVSTTKGDYQRSIMIPVEIEKTEGKIVIGTTDFDISKEECMALYTNGYTAASKFLENWDFSNWKQAFRGTYEDRLV